MQSYESCMAALSLMDYDPNSGIFLWKERAVDVKGWNARHSGKPVGTKDKNGYATVVISIDGHKCGFKLHRLAWLYCYGELPFPDIDHINHDRADNRIENLRCVSRSQNHRNLSVGERNTSGVLGVCRTGYKSLPWRARFFHNKKEVMVGKFSSIEEAEKALKKARAAYGYHENHGENL